MASYALVHGAWSGAHGFHRVRTVLQGVGHQVFTPSLTGVGERAHLTSPGLGLSTHVSDVVTGAVDHVASRIRHLVYLDAFVPEDGESVFSLTGTTRAPMNLNDPWLIPPTARDFDDPAEAVFMNARRTPQPIGCSARRSDSPVPSRTMPSPGHTSGQRQIGPTLSVRRPSTQPPSVRRSHRTGATTRSRRTT